VPTAAWAMREVTDLVRPGRRARSGAAFRALARRPALGRQVARAAIIRDQIINLRTVTVATSQAPV
jgi:hypothetical protein